MPSLKVLLSAEQIHNRIAELGAEIDRDYPSGEPVYLIAVLKGAFIFMADLSRAMKTPARIEFIGISSYGKGKTSSGQVQLTKDLDAPIEGHHVIIVEDILDTGITLNYLTKLMAQRKPKSLRIVALLDKPERRKSPVKADYVGFTIPDEFVVGYGLDYAEDYRNLKDVCVMGRRLILRRAQQWFQRPQHRVRNNLRSLGGRMDTVALEVAQISRDDVLQQKRNQRQLILGGQTAVNGLEVVNVIRTVVGRQRHSRQHHARAHPLERDDHLLQIFTRHRQRQTRAGRRCRRVPAAPSRASVRLPVLRRATPPAVVSPLIPRFTTCHA